MKTLIVGQIAFDETWTGDGLSERESLAWLRQRCETLGGMAANTAAVYKGLAPDVVERTDYSRRRTSA